MNSYKSVDDVDSENLERVYREFAICVPVDNKVTFKTFGMSQYKCEILTKSKESKEFVITTMNMADNAIQFVNLKAGTLIAIKVCAKEASIRGTLCAALSMTSIDKQEEFE